MNWYAYAGNNPASWVDPTGLGFIDTVKGVGRAIVNGAKKVVAVPEAALSWALEQAAQVLWDPVKVDVPANGGAELGRGQGFDAREAAKQCLVKPVLVTGAAGLGKAAEALDFASGDLLADHFGRHGTGLGYKTAGDYVAGARALFRGGEGIETYVRQGGDTVFFKAATKEFGVLSKDNVIRTYYFAPGGRDYFLSDIRTHP